LYNYIDFSQFKADEFLVYLRKSRSDDPLLSVEEVLARHEAMLDEWAEKNLGEKIPEKNKFREVVSGETIADRPEIQTILKKIESPKIKAVLIVEVQRLSRGDLEDAGRIIKLFRFTNTLVVTPPKAYDLHDEYDRDSFERELKRGNEFLSYVTKIMGRGKEISVLNEGNFIGSVAPYGYDKSWIKDGKKKCPTLAINEDEANVVRMIFDMYVNKDMGTPNIAHALDALHIPPRKGEHWSQATIKDIISNVHYIGMVKWNCRKTVRVVEDSEVIKTRPRKGEYAISEGRHEAIISEELFNAAQNKRSKNPRNRKTTNIVNPLAGILYCKCGKAMQMKHYKANGREYYSFACYDQVHCGTGSSAYKVMIEAVSNILRQSIADFEIRIKNDTGDSVKLHENLIKTLEKKLKDINARELAQWEAQANPDPSMRMPSDIFRQLNERLQKEKADVQEALHEAYETIPESVDYVEKVQTFREALDALLDPERSAKEKNRLLKDCIDRIDYNREKPVRLRKEKGVKKGEQFTEVGGKWTNPDIQLEVTLRV
jgi:hypothetical protein